jgi:hypothetical protein
MFLTEIVDLSNVYTFTKKKDSDLNMWSYNFKTNDDFNFSVDFIHDEDDSWSRHFRTKEKMFDELNTKEKFKILNTITKITLDFIDTIKPKKIKIYHVRSRKEFVNHPNDENKRLRVNKYFLSKVLPNNYKINTFGNESEINLVESKQVINEIAELTNTYSYEKISSNDDKVKYRFSDGEDIFFVKFTLLSIGKFGEEYEREYYNSKKWMDELNKGNGLRILGTVTKITLDFINDYKPGIIQISHIDSKKEISSRYSIDAILSGKSKNQDINKRAKINRLFLSKNLPDDYRLDFVSNITQIKRKDLN